MYDSARVISFEERPCGWLMIVYYFMLFFIVALLCVVCTLFVIFILPFVGFCKLVSFFSLKQTFIQSFRTQRNGINLNLFDFLSRLKWQSFGAHDVCVVSFVMLSVRYMWCYVLFCSWNTVTAFAHYLYRSFYHRIYEPLWKWRTFWNLNFSFLFVGLVTVIPLSFNCLKTTLLSNCFLLKSFA